MGGKLRGCQPHGGRPRYRLSQALLLVPRQQTRILHQGKRSDVQDQIRYVTEENPRYQLDFCHNLDNFRSDDLDL